MTILDGAALTFSIARTKELAFGNAEGFKETGTVADLTLLKTSIDAVAAKSVDAGILLAAELVEDASKSPSQFAPAQQLLGLRALLHLVDKQIDRASAIETATVIVAFSDLVLPKGSVSTLAMDAQNKLAELQSSNDADRTPRTEKFFDATGRKYTISAQEAQRVFHLETGNEAGAGGTQLLSIEHNFGPPHRRVHALKLPRAFA